MIPPTSGDPMITKYNDTTEEGRFCPACHDTTRQTLDAIGWFCTSCEEYDNRVDMPKLKKLNNQEMLELVLMEGGYCPRCSLPCDRDGCPDGDCGWPFHAAE